MSAGMSESRSLRARHTRPAGRAAGLAMRCGPGTPTAAQLTLCLLCDAELRVAFIASLGVPFKNFVNRFVCLLLLFYGAKYST